MERPRKLAVAIGAVALLAATACGSRHSTSPPSTGGTPKLTITSIENGATVTLPFKLVFTAGVPIGQPTSGKDHVHVFVDGRTDQYQVVTSSPYEVTNLPPGQHTIGVTLQHADHSFAGARAQVSVNVSGGSGGTPSSVPSPSTGGYNY